MGSLEVAAPTERFRYLLDGHDCSSLHRQRATTGIEEGSSVSALIVYCTLTGQRMDRFAFGAR